MPHVGCPHNDPVTIARHVNINPIGAILLETNIKFLILNIKFKIEINAIKVKDAKPIQAAGT